MEPIDGQQAGCAGPVGEGPGGELHPVIGVYDQRPGRAARLRMAMSRALVTSAAVWVASMDQPTTRREKVSRTTAQ